MSRLTILILLILGLFLISSIWFDSEVAAGYFFQTIPTRTPVPPTPRPDDDGDDDDDGDEPPPALPTNTPIPTSTSTPIPPTNTPLVSTGAIPTAEPCGDPPTVQAVGTTNVRRGPGTDYEVVGQLAFSQVRYIVGRAGDAAWWMIQYSEQDQAWVADRVVDVQGYTGNVPIAPAPSIDGESPTPGAAWEPTAIPFCTVTPTFTPSPTTAATATATSTSTAAATPTASATATAEIATDTPEATLTATASATPAATATAETTMTPTRVASEETEATTLSSADETPAAAPLDIDAPSRTLDILPIVGLILLIAGVVLTIVRRQQQT